MSARSQRLSEDGVITPNARAAPPISVMLDDDKKHETMRFAGGEGILKILSTRESGFTLFGIRNRYWLPTIFCIHGRALPLIPFTVYTIYCVVAVVALIQTMGDDYKTKPELKGVQFPVQSMGLALFLLLAFRTNSCYDRWWEGRKLWDGIGGRCQELVRVVTAWVGHDDPKLTWDVMRWTMTTLVAFQWQLKGKKHHHHQRLLKHLLLTRKEYEEFATAQSPVMLTTDKLSALMPHPAIKVIPAPMINNLDQNIRGLMADLISCCRIITTPMPFAYVVHLRSFMVIWLVALPFAFLPQLGYWTIAICVLIAYQLFGFEEIGLEIESPFGDEYNDLPIDAMVEDFLQPILAKVPLFAEESWSKWLDSKKALSFKGDEKPAGDQNAV